MYVGFGKISAQLHTLIMHTPRLWDLHHCFEDFLMIFFLSGVFSNASNFARRAVTTYRATPVLQILHYLCEISEDVKET